MKAELLSPPAEQEINTALIPTVSTLHAYQQHSRSTYSKVLGMPTEVYLAIGLSEEVGEALGKIKKVYRDHDGDFSPERIAAIKYELGDALWYLTNLAVSLGISLEDVANSNLRKLESRRQRNQLNGNGDNR